jgi:hypothetical protein
MITDYLSWYKNLLLEINGREDIVEKLNKHRIP